MTHIYTQQIIKEREREEGENSRRVGEVALQHGRGGRALRRCAQWPRVVAKRCVLGVTVSSERMREEGGTRTWENGEDGCRGGVRLSTQQRWVG